MEAGVWLLSSPVQPLCTKSLLACERRRKRKALGRKPQGAVGMKVESPRQRATAPCKLRFRPLSRA